jgi:hypothetical protein
MVVITVIMDKLNPTGQNLAHFSTLDVALLVFAIQ